MEILQLFRDVTLRELLMLAQQHVEDARYKLKVTVTSVNRKDVSSID